jgi:excinuclease ABC subunit A
MTVDLAAEGSCRGREKESQADAGAMKGAGIPANRIVFSEKFACPVSGFTIAEIEPRLFLLQRPARRLPGLRRPRREAAVRRGARRPQPRAQHQEGRDRPLGQVQPAQPLLHAGARQPRPRISASASTRPGRTARRGEARILHGTGGKPVTLTFVDGRKSYEVRKPFEGVIGNLNRRMLQTESAWMREELSKYQTERSPARPATAPASSPRRWRSRSPCERHLHATRLSVVDALAWFTALPEQAHRPAEPDRQGHPQGDQRAARLPQQCRPRLSQPRPHQRHALGRREPAHPPRLADRQRPVGRALRPRRAQHRPPPARQRHAARTLKRLRDLGNTVLVVEHDEDAIRTADYIIDMGPGAGVHGGEIVAQGTLDEDPRHQGSITADYLNGTPRVPCPPSAARAMARSSPSTTPPPTTSGRHRQRSRSAPSPASPASAARASRASPSTRSMPPPPAPSTARASSPASMTRSPASNISTR